MGVAQTAPGRSDPAPPTPPAPPRKGKERCARPHHCHLPPRLLLAGEFRAGITGIRELAGSSRRPGGSRGTFAQRLCPFLLDAATEADLFQHREHARDIHVALAEGQVDMAAALHVLDRHRADPIGELAHGLGRVALAGDEASGR